MANLGRQEIINTTVVVTRKRRLSERIRTTLVSVQNIGTRDCYIYKGDTATHGLKLVPGAMFRPTDDFSTADLFVTGATVVHLREQRINYHRRKKLVHHSG